MSNPIVFFGSGPVAAKSLELLSRDFSVEAVVTKPRPAHHKGDVPVLKTAEELQLPVFTAANKAELDALFSKTSFVARIAILVDFGIIVSQKVIDYFPLGIANSHFSLLPAWRGADPITFAVLHGDKQTGVSLMLLVEAMDEGPLIAQAPVDLDPATTTPELTDLLIDISYAALREVIPLYVKGDVFPVQQPTDVPVSYSRRLTKADGLIDWHKPAHVLEREIKAFAGWPKSRSTLGGKEVIITKAYAAQDKPPNAKPGDVTVKREDGAIVVATKDGSLHIQCLKPSGKREMTALEFVAGNRL